MAVKIYVDGTSLIINTGAGSDLFERNTNDVTVLVDHDDTNRYRFFEVINGITKEYWNGDLVADVFQDAGAVPYTNATFETFYRNIKKKVVSLDSSEGILTTEYLLEVKKGNVPGHSWVEKFGAAASIPNTLTVIASAQIYQTPTALTSLELVSTDNVNDLAAGTGARKVEVIGIGAGYTETSEIITLNGTTPVALATQFYRVYRMKVVESGQYSNPTQSSHNSTITLNVLATPANIWATIGQEGTFGLGQSEIGAYTIPAGKTGYLLSKNIGFEASKNASVFMFVRDKIDVVAAPFGAMRSLELDRNINNRIDVVPRGVLAILEEKTDVGFMAKSITGTTALSVDFEILLVDN